MDAHEHIPTQPQLIPEDQEMNENRKLNLKSTLLICSGLIVLMLILSTYAWFQIPAGEKIPVHWGIDGEPDRYGSKLEGLFLLPGISFFLLILFSFLPLLEPRRMHLWKSEKAFKIIITGLFYIRGTVCIGNEIEYQQCDPFCSWNPLFNFRKLHGQDPQQFLCRHSYPLDSFQRTFMEQNPPLGW